MPLGGESALGLPGAVPAQRADGGDVKGDGTDLPGLGPVDEHVLARGVKGQRRGDREPTAVPVDAVPVDAGSLGGAELARPHAGRDRDR